MRGKNIIITLIMLVLLLASCTRKVCVPVESVRVRTDTVREMALRVDSVVLRDSVAVVQKGDTVRITRWRDRYRLRQRTDTVYRVMIDSVRVRVPVPVERPLSSWERVKMEAGGWAIGAGSALLLVSVALLAWLIRTKRRK